MVILLVSGIVTGIVFLANKPLTTKKVDRSKTESPKTELNSVPWKPEEELKVFSKYAGSDSCRKCHQEEFNLWHGSDHQLAERLPDPTIDSEAFSPKREFTHPTATSQMYAHGDRFHIATKGVSGKQETFNVERVIGETPLRQYLVQFPRGLLQAVDLSHDPHKNEWFNVFGDEDRQPGEWGHWTGRGMNWNTQCASCHNTRLRKNHDEATDSYHTTMAERSVGCEACHGPMKAHVDWRLEHPDSSTPDPTVRTLDHAQWLAACGACHSRRTELTGDFQPGDRYLDHFSHVIPDETDIYYADGQVRGENYVLTSFLGSNMYHAGVRCMDCHEPHTGKTLQAGNALCMRCHTGVYPNSPKIDPPTHTHHSLNGAGGQCVNCHMPETTYMQRDPRRDHGFTIPDPLLTKEHGIPNACNRCHADKDADWALAAVEKWYGPRMNRPARQRARIIAQAREGSENSRDDLLQLLREEKTPFWKAVATELIHPWAGDPEVATTILGNLASTNALLRGTSARSLNPLARRGDTRIDAALGRLLDDPVRKVRVDAAWVLRDRVDPKTTAGSDLVRMLTYNVDMPTGALQKGLYHLDRNEAELAESYFRRAIELDGHSAPLRHEYAIALSMMRRPQDAIAALQEAIRLDPREAEYHYKLALGWNETGDLGKTVNSLVRAVQLNPRHARAWYNLGLARNSMNQPEAAIAALLKAESVSPNDPDPPYARVTILQRLGRISEAIETAQRVLEIQPNHPDALGFLRTMGL
ncbi:MAG: tetratricopeptide repeat protein [Verrucomicrobiota bacterium]|nr:tetratricopeptide repeat protein [Verrucomicrobiota bacterium]